MDTTILIFEKFLIFEKIVEITKELLNDLRFEPETGQDASVRRHGDSTVRRLGVPWRASQACRRARFRRLDIAPDWRVRCGIPNSVQYNGASGVQRGQNSA